MPQDPPTVFKSQTVRSILLAALTGIVAAVFSLSPQINLWISKGTEYNGVYATHDSDEVGYAAYVQSLIDGKPRRNSPYTGVEDGSETPLKESLFSIQFIAFYPIAVIARTFGLSSSGALILASALYGFLSGLAVFWLFFILFRNAFLSFSGAFVLLACGALAAGQGNLIRSYAPETIFYGIAFPFARRIVPLAGVPALFLFFGGVWKIIDTDEFRKRLLYLIATTLAFAVLVYSYFYLWTAAFAWLAGLGVLMLLLRPEKYRRSFTSLLALAGAMFVILVPYFVLIADRAESTDAVQLLQHTRMPDLTRPPEILSLFAASLFVLLAAMRKIDLKAPLNLFLFSFALVAPIVFNQQVITGRSLQPVHYQFFAANYTALFAFLSAVFLFLTGSAASKYLNKCLLIVTLLGVYVGFIEFKDQISLDILRDDIVPVANEIREVSSTNSDIVLSFDAAGFGYPTSDEIPSLASRPVLWAPHQRVFPDISADENLERFFYFLYLQNRDDAWLREKLLRKDSLVVHGIFGWSRNEKDVLAENEPISQDEIDEVVDRYRTFTISFDNAKAAKYPVSFVVAHELAKDAFGTLDKYYDRELLGKFKKYLLFRTRLRES